MNSQELVPYITSWSAEEEPPAELIRHPFAGIGLGYADESRADRDDRGVLWKRAQLRQGEGRPLFSQVHPLRQRRVMRRLLCQVCAKPADHNDLGTLWMLQDGRDDWPNWPENLNAIEPPICLPCAHTSRRACPALRRGHVTVRVQNPTLTGICGLCYQPNQQRPQAVAGVIVEFDDPLIRWTIASQLVRKLRGCTIVDLDT